MRNTSAGLGRHDEVPQFAAVARMAGIFPGEHESEIAQPHLLEPARGPHDDMVAHAAQDAADHHDHAGVGPGAPGGAGGRDPIGRNRGGIEARDVDMGGHDDEAVRRHLVALGNHLGDLVAQRDHLLAAGHHAVVGMLEPVLVAEFGVPGGDEGHPGHAGGGKGAPARRAGERMHHPAMALADEPRQGDGIVSNDRRIAARHIELTNCAPRAASSPSSRPPEETTSARCPAAVKVPASSTASSSAAPPSSVGTAIMTVKGSRANAGENAAAVAPANLARPSSNVRDTVVMSATSPTPFISAQNVPGRSWITWRRSCRPQPR